MSTQTQRNRVLAIDPGYDRVGIAVMDGDALLFSECYSPTLKNFSFRLKDIHEHARDLVKKYAPSAVALETLFFSRNQKTAIKVAEARGIIMLAGLLENVPVYEYSPQEVKMAVTGSGAATKPAVMKMVQRILKLEPKKRLDDEFDAIALAIAHQSIHRSL